MQHMRPEQKGLAVELKRLLGHVKMYIHEVDMTTVSLFARSFVYRRFYTLVVVLKEGRRITAGALVAFRRCKTNH